MTTSARPTDAPPTAGQRTRRRQQRRDQVYRAAVALFVERGYDNTTMDDIAQRADVARATVFNHFERKAAFLDEWASRRRHRAVAAIRKEHLEDHDLSEILARYMRELARINVASREETVALMGAAPRSASIFTSPALGQELAAYLARGQQRGQVRADIDPTQAGLLLASGYFLTLFRWIRTEPEPFELRRELLSMLDLVLRGVVATH